MKDVTRLKGTKRNADVNFPIASIKSHNILNHTEID